MCLIYSKRLLLTVGTCLLISGCSQEQKIEYADEENDTSSEKEPEAKRRTFTYNANVTDEGLSLADATEYDISLTGCASTQSVTITEANPYLELYEFDRNCLAKLTEFKLNGKTYTPKTGALFDDWAVGDVATFEVASANPVDELRVEILKTIPATVAANGEIHYQFSEITKGTDQTVVEDAVRESASVAVNGQASPQFTIKNIYFVGVTADGNGEFRFQLECDATVTGTGNDRKCYDIRFDEIEMLLVKDTYSGTLNQTQLDTIWGTVTEAPQVIDMTNDVFSAGAGTPVLAKGGFTTANSGEAAVMVMSGTKPVASNRDMIFILKAGVSYTYYTISVEAITQSNNP